LGYCGGLMCDEVSNLESLQNAYGGGYEIVLYDKDAGFYKLDNIAYLFWHAHIFDDDEIRISPKPLRLCQYSYSGDLLVIRSVSFKDLGGIKSIDVNEFIAPPINRIPSIEDQERAAEAVRDPTMICSYFFVTSKKPGFGVLAAVHWD